MEQKKAEPLFYTSDWHIHTEVSYDAELTAEQLTEGCRAQGIVRCGITDHVNLPSWGDTLLKSQKNLERCRELGMSRLYLGVELTTRAKHVCDYDRLHPGEWSPIWDGATAQDEIELTLTAEELAGYGVNYVLGAALLENGKALEYNLSRFAIPSCGHSKNFCYASAESIIGRISLCRQAVHMPAAYK